MRSGATASRVTKTGSGPFRTDRRIECGTIHDPEWRCPRVFARPAGSLLANYVRDHAPNLRLLLRFDDRLLGSELRTRPNRHPARPEALADPNRSHGRAGARGHVQPMEGIRRS